LPSGQLSPATSLGPQRKNVTSPVGVGPPAIPLTAAVSLAEVPGATAPVLDGSQDVILRLEAAGSDPVSLLAPAGKFQVKGKKLTLTDADGSVIKAMRDQPKSADPDQQPAPLPPTKGGSVVIKGSKKRTTVIFKVQGVEAAKLSGSGQAMLAIGVQIGERPTTFAPGKKSIKIH